MGKEAFTRDRFDEFWNKFYQPDTEFIRPSGNPLDREGFAAMFANDDISEYTSQFVDVNSAKLRAGGQIAVATCTQREMFKYKGTPNDDLAKFSYVLEKGAQGWRVVHAHRATGQPPAATA